jgi:hypothetical protein
MEDGKSADHDHWDMFAESVDLTIEGHRLIAEEIIYEARLLCRAAMTWLRDLTGVVARHPSPPG